MTDKELADQLLDKVWTDVAIERRIKDGDKKLGRKTLSNSHTRIRATLALRSGFEKRCQLDSIDKLAEQEFKEASNGERN